MKRDEKIRPKKGKRHRVSTKKESFLKAFARCGIIALAAKRAKCLRTQHYRWLANDPEYPQRFAEAQAAAIEYLEEILLTQAESGNVTATIFALKAALPEKYRENHRLEMTGADGGPIRSLSVSVDLTAPLNVKELSEAQLLGLLLQDKALRAGFEELIRLYVDPDVNTLEGQVALPPLAIEGALATTNGVARALRLTDEEALAEYGYVPNPGFEEIAWKNKYRPRSEQQRLAEICERYPANCSPSLLRLAGPTKSSLVAARDDPLA